MAPASVFLLSLLWGWDVAPAAAIFGALAVPAVVCFGWLRKAKFNRVRAALLSSLLLLATLLVVLFPALVGMITGSDPGLPIRESAVLIALTVVVSYVCGCVVFEMLKNVVQKAN